MDINYPKGAKFETKITKPDNGGCALSVMSVSTLAILKKMVDKEIRDRKRKLTQAEFSEKMDSIFNVIRQICESSAKKKKS